MTTTGTTFRSVAGRRPGLLVRRGSVSGERGTMTVELVLFTPVLFALLAFIVGLGRAADARGQLTGAVRDAARAASLAATPEAARTAARDTALADLQSANLHCRQPQVDTDTGQFTAGGQVTVTIRCSLDLAQLVMSGLPGRSTLTATSTVPLDTYSSHNSSQISSQISSQLSAPTRAAR
jgi:Flp pilus assembly protein TadG